jgi:hypothetical protein
MKERLSDEARFRVICRGSGDRAPAAANYVRAVDSLDRRRAAQFRQHLHCDIDSLLTAPRRCFRRVVRRDLSTDFTHGLSQFAWREAPADC